MIKSSLLNSRHFKYAFKYKAFIIEAPVIDRLRGD